MKNILLLHFGITLVTLLITGSGFFLPALIAIALSVAQRLAVKFKLLPPPLPAPIKILGICYAANFLVMIVGWIL